MTSQSIMLLIAFLAVLLVLSYPLGKFIVQVAAGSSDHAPAARAWGVTIWSGTGLASA